MYREDCEPIDKLRVRDLCIVYYDLNWYRAQVVNIVGEIGKARLAVHLIDYGRTIHTLERYVGKLKMPHEAIIPFVNRCQLSLLCADDNVPSDAILEEFENISKGSNQIALYFNSINREEDIYDVTLMSECQSNMNTTYDAYLLHETYSAIVRSAIVFDDDICKDWSQHILQNCNKSTADNSKKYPVDISHIVSPSEIYVKCIAAEASMPRLRRKIHEYIRKHKNAIKKQWSIADDCLVRVQNWRTEATLKLWCRGRIVELCREKGEFKVFLRDYGRTVDATDTDLMAIAHQMAAPADTVQQCRLIISDVWPKSATNVLREIINEYAHFAISCSAKDGTCLSITLWATNLSPDTKRQAIWDDIGLRLVSQSVIKSMQPFIKKSQRRYNRTRFRSNYNCDSDSDISYESLNLDDLSLIVQDKLDISGYTNDTNDDVGVVSVAKWHPAIPIDCACIIGTVTHVTPEGIIYAQEESNYELAFELEQRITRHVKRMDRDEFKNRAWKKGDTCFAWKRSITFEQGVYCRAVIEKIDAENGLCMVISVCLFG